MNEKPYPEEQHAQANLWASWLALDGLIVELHGTGQAEPFHREWWVFRSWNGPRAATIDIDGCGASWHGPDALYTKHIGARLLAQELAEAKKL
jgi:hypothetical protein